MDPGFRRDDTVYLASARRLAAGAAAGGHHALHLAQRVAVAVDREQRRRLGQVDGRHRALHLRGDALERYSTQSRES